jgi:hypothetical protein
MDDSKITTDHREIKDWAEKHDGVPVVLKDPASGRPTALSIFFPDRDVGAPVEEISWSKFFREFDEKDGEFVYKDSEESNFFKIIEH